MRGFVPGILSFLLAVTMVSPAISHSPDKMSAEDSRYLNSVQATFDQLKSTDKTQEKNTGNTYMLRRLSTICDALKAVVTYGTVSREDVCNNIQGAVLAISTNKFKAGEEAQARLISDRLAQIAIENTDTASGKSLLESSYLLCLKCGTFDDLTLAALQRLTNKLAQDGNRRFASGLWRQAVTFIDDKNRPASLVPESIVAENFMAALRKFGNEMDAADQELRARGKIVKSPDRIDLEERIKHLEKSTSKNSDELCDAQLKMARWYFSDSNFNAGNKVLNTALNHLEDTAITALDSKMSQDLMLAIGNIIPLTDNSSNHLIERSYCLIEEKAEGGVSHTQLLPLIHSNTEQGSPQAARNIALIQKLISMRERQENANSVKLKPLLYALNDVQQKNGEYEEPIANQTRIIRLIQSEKGMGSDTEILETAKLALICIKAQKFSEAKTNCDSTIALALRRQSSPWLKSAVSDQLGDLAKAYCESDKTEEADIILRQGIDMSDATSAPGEAHVSLAGAVDALVDKYKTAGQLNRASALLQFVVDKPNFGAEGISTNAWRYQLAQLYLDISNSAAAGADELKAKSKKIFDQAQEVSRKNTALTTPRVTAFIQQRREALQKYGMGAEASALQNQ